MSTKWPNKTDNTTHKSQKTTKIDWNKIQEFKHVYSTIPQIAFNVVLHLSGASVTRNVNGNIVTSRFLPAKTDLQKLNW